MASINQLIADSEQIRDETIPGANSANRVGTLFDNVSKTFAQFVGSPRSFYFEFIQKILSRNTDAPFLEIDTSNSPSGNMGGTLFIEVNIFASARTGNAANAQAMISRVEQILFVQNADGSSFDFVFSQINSVQKIAINAALTDFIDLVVNPVQIATGKYRLSFENAMSGSQSPNPNITGYVRITPGGFLNEPIFNLL